MNEEAYAVPDAELKPWELRIRRWTERHPDQAAKIDEAIQSEKPALWLVTAFWTLLFVVPPLLLAIVFTVLDCIYGHPWEGPAISFWIVTPICVLMVCDGYRQDKRTVSKDARIASTSAKSPEKRP